MIGPGGRGKQHALHAGDAQKITGDTQRAGAAHALNAKQIAVGAEHQVLHQPQKLRDPLLADIGFRRLALVQAAFRLLDRAHHRRGAVFVAIDADAEIDFVRPLILTRAAHDLEQGIGRQRFESGNHRRLLLVRAQSGKQENLLAFGRKCRSESA